MLVHGLKKTTQIGIIYGQRVVFQSLKLEKYRISANPTLEILDSGILFV